MLNATHSWLKSVGSKLSKYMQFGTFKSRFFHSYVGADIIWLDSGKEHAPKASCGRLLWNPKPTESTPVCKDSWVCHPCFSCTKQMMCQSHVCVSWSSWVLFKQIFPQTFMHASWIQGPVKLRSLTFHDSNNWLHRAQICGDMKRERERERSQH